LASSNVLENNFKCLLAGNIWPLPSVIVNLLLLHPVCNPRLLEDAVVSGSNFAKVPKIFRVNLLKIVRKEANLVAYVAPLVAHVATLSDRS
jgi:hypothetical protein